MADTDARKLTGLEELRQRFFGEGEGVFTGIGKTLEGNPDERMYNPLGIVHGGYAATLLDSAVGCAVHSRLPAGQAYTTLELKVAYHRALTKESGPVKAEGVVLTLGRRVAFAEGKLTDAQGRLCASATSTLLIM